MSEAVYRMLAPLCTPLPIGTNLGLLLLSWMPVIGQLRPHAGRSSPA